MKKIREAKRHHKKCRPNLDCESFYKANDGFLQQMGVGWREPF